MGSHDGLHSRIRTIVYRPDPAPCSPALTLGAWEVHPARIGHRGLHADAWSPPDDRTSRFMITGLLIAQRGSCWPWLRRSQLPGPCHTRRSRSFSSRRTAGRSSWDSPGSSWPGWRCASSHASRERRRPGCASRLARWSCSRCPRLAG
jgi:hypothetical protein